MEQVKHSFLSTASRKVTILAVLTALGVICACNFPTGLTVRIGMYIKLSPGFLVVALAGVLYGWKGAVAVSVLSDLLQSLLFGQFSPLICLVNLLIGVCFGLFLYRKVTLLRIVLSAVITQVVGGLGLITAVLCFQYGMPFFPMIYWRMLQTAILIVLEIGLLSLTLIVLRLPQRLMGSRQS